VNQIFDPDERLLRAILPKDMFWKNGRPTSAAFKTEDDDGLSVDRQGNRSIESSLAYIRKHLSGEIASVTYNECTSAEIGVKYAPSRRNLYHSLLNGKDTVSPTPRQARYLASICVVHNDHEDTMVSGASEQTET